MKKSVELLSPAGNYEAFLGAVNAGADAVYLGGDRFGARAYADNFTAEEICRAIRTAHFMGKRVYLTVNTLVKDRELDGLKDWLAPFYETGLDGVIVQDVGVLRYIGEHFPDLALHASTQMALTGAGGGAFLREHGVSRIVPARELSLQEIREIKRETDLEIECFVHGAMCYCYSGQCLFSSILGGRSGNRGRCAQPCRLPYRVCEDGKPIGIVDYPLSLKDMCTVDCIPQLIEAGIDSFKIEGRMKKPEYTAGVTAIYRKYIDLYEAEGAGRYQVAPEDRNTLRSLYIRSEVQTGYYERHNGREMITLHEPGYAGSSKALLDEIRRAYIHEPDKFPVDLHATLRIGEPAVLEISDGRGVRVSVRGGTVQAARKKPLASQEIARQLTKTGNTPVRIADCEITMSDDVFLPVSALNDLRRRGVEAFLRQRIESQGMIAERGRVETSGSQSENEKPTRSVNIVEKPSDDISSLHDAGRDRDARTDILVSSCGQLAAAAAYACRRIYIDSDLYLARREQVAACMREYGDHAYFLALPYVLRARDGDYLRRLTSSVREDRRIEGFLIRNYEEAAYVRSLGESYSSVPDAGLYVFNREGLLFWRQYSAEYTLPYELNAREIGALTAFSRGVGLASVMIIYGRIPMMISANCVRKTAGRCLSDVCAKTAAAAKMPPVCLKDRYGTYFPVETNCTHCYNIIYNSVPYSLLAQKNELTGAGADVWRYDFTTESREECRRILESADLPRNRYTTGHFKRGVE